MDGREAAGGGILTIPSGDKASDVEAAITAKTDELGKSARHRNSPADGKAVPNGALVTISRSAQNGALCCCRMHGHSNRGYAMHTAKYFTRGCATGMSD